MIDIRRNLMVRREVWFDERWQRDGADLLVFYHWSEALNPCAALEVDSLEIDLTQEQGSIWKGFTASTRNQINRAIKDGLSFQVWTSPPAGIIADFFAFRREFAAARGMDLSDPVWMHDYAAQGALMLTLACAPDGKALVWHAYSRGPAWVRQLHSVSLGGDAGPEERRAIGRANRFLHWMDMLESQKLGIERFDFGGWYSGNTDEKLLRINEFKEEFGGRKTRRYHSMLSASAKGKLYLLARERLKGDRGLVHYV